MNSGVWVCWFSAEDRAGAGCRWRPAFDGSRPVSRVATGEHGAFRVTRTMATSVPDVCAASDGVETWHRVLQRPTYLPPGTTAHKQGRVAGENAPGGTVEVAGTPDTQTVKVFDLVIACTGLRDSEARQAGCDPLTVESRHPDHNVYYPCTRKLAIRVTGNGRVAVCRGRKWLDTGTRKWRNV